MTDSARAMTDLEN